METQYTTTDPCPCGSEQPFGECCGPLLAGQPAPTAEALMRSRYSAFVVKQYPYLKTSLIPRKAKKFNLAMTEAWGESVEWKGLTILETSLGGKDDTTGEVYFKVDYNGDGKDQVLRERAEFSKKNNHWYYVDGIQSEGDEEPEKVEPVRVSKVGRNDPCPCGSGKKFKKCCA